MHASFTFCGTDIETLGLNYAPELEDTVIENQSHAVSHYESSESHNGGYMYGWHYEPKEFILRCYFEEKNIEFGILTRIQHLFKVGNAGKLVFSRSPWCYYNAVVTDPIEYGLTNYLNGIITIHMKAMYPFARSEVYVNTWEDEWHDKVMERTAALEKPEMLLPDRYTPGNQIYNVTNPIILPNQGTERAALGVAIAGNVGAGVIITNETTGQSCKFVAITKDKTTNVNKEVILDPISGKTMLVGAGTKQLAFLYHEFGFLELESSYPAIRNIYITSSGSTTLTVTNMIEEDVVGKYIYTPDGWRKIVEQPDKHTLVVNDTVTSRSTHRTMIMLMNEITVKPITTMDISSLRFIYKPTYA